MSENRSTSPPYIDVASAMKIICVEGSRLDIRQRLRNIYDQLWLLPHIDLPSAHDIKQDRFIGIPPSILRCVALYDLNKSKLTSIAKYLNELSDKHPGALQQAEFVVGGRKLALQDVDTLYTVREHETALIAAKNLFDLMPPIVRGNPNVTVWMTQMLKVLDGEYFAGSFENGEILSANVTFIHALYHGAVKWVGLGNSDAANYEWEVMTNVIASCRPHIDEAYHFIVRDAEVRQHNVSVKAEPTRSEIKTSSLPNSLTDCLKQ